MCEEKQAIKRWELVELSVPGSSTGRIVFNTIPQLRNQANQVIVIKSITVFSASTYLNSQTNNSIGGMPDGEVPKAVLVLYVNGEESIKMIPLVQLMNVGGISNLGFKYDSTMFDDLTNVDFDKSYVQFSSASDATPYVIPFGITYLRMQRDPTSGAFTEG